ncbi:MAG TPA: hypothetical protein VEJ37_08680 [Xanthobacteraceae bacterium]|nr:hypothetical protein [Xanthobacteraceae bacterium]
MLTRSVAKIILAGALAAVAISPALATWPNACAKPDGRCTATATCNKEGWCKVYGCIVDKTVLLPFACNVKAGGCLQKHC